VRAQPALLLKIRFRYLLFDDAHQSLLSLHPRNSLSPSYPLRRDLEVESFTFDPFPNKNFLELGEFVESDMLLE
jgi:hypothetical protein